MLSLRATVLLEKQMSQRTFLYQVNLTRDCNLRCTHCYIHSDTKAASKKMDIDSVVQIGKGIGEHMRGLGYERAEIHFIGGEPTMLGLQWFREAVPAFRSALGGGFCYDLSIVSNLISPDIVEIASLFDRVNTSWEPQTRFVSLAGLYKPALEAKWESSLLLLRQAGLVVGVTSAITRSLVEMGAQRVIEHLTKLGLTRIHFGFFIPEGDGLVHIDKNLPRFAETSQFLIDAANWAMLHRDNNPDLWINPFESLLLAIDRDEPVDDIVCPIVAGSIDINWDGNAASCLEAGGSDQPRWAGNVVKDGVAAVTQSPFFREEVARAARGAPGCITCEDFLICNAGCGVLAKYAAPDESDCHGFRRFITHVRKLHEKGARPRDIRFTGFAC